MRSMLRFHRSYRCRDSGACCTSGWPIPVEAPLYRTVDAAMGAGRLTPSAGASSAAFAEADLPADYARLLAVDAHGACVFHDASRRRCAIHQALGPTAKPLSCRAFPRIVVHDPRGVSISLSHYCPSAADLLFQPEPIELVDLSAPAGGNAPSGLLDDLEALDGLDARDALPPLLREGVLVDWESLTRWERHVADVLNRADSPEAALACLWRSYEALHSWRAANGPLAAHVERLASVAEPNDASGAPAAGRRAALVSAVRAAIPEALRPESPVVRPDVAVETVEPERRASEAVVCRYVAARAHACWPLHQGAHGLRSQLVYLDAVLALARTFLLATADLRESIRQADLWLVHLASPVPLAASLDALLPRGAWHQERDTSCRS